MTTQQWFWVTGSVKTGFKIKNSTPRGKGRKEPHRDRESAERWIALQYLLNA